MRERGTHAQRFTDRSTQCKVTTGSGVESHSPVSTVPSSRLICCSFCANFCCRFRFITSSGLEIVLVKEDSGTLELLALACWAAISSFCRFFRLEEPQRRLKGWSGGDSMLEAWRRRGGAFSYRRSMTIAATSVTDKNNQSFLSNMWAFATAQCSESTKVNQNSSQLLLCN